MSQQSPRALVGDQGGRGAHLNPVRRLSLAGACVIAGGAVVAIGSRLAWATVTINPSGRVSSAQVTGKFAGTPTGTCVASAVKGASFPRFKGQAMSGIDYPFMLSK